MKLKPGFFKVNINSKKPEDIKYNGNNISAYPVTVNFTGNFSNVWTVPRYSNLKFNSDDYSGYAIYYISESKPRRIIKIDSRVYDYYVVKD